MKMWIFIREITAGALIIILFTSMTGFASAQSSYTAARNKTPIITVAATQNMPLTLKFDGIDLAAYEKSTADAVQRDILSRVRSAVKRADIKASPAEMERATKKIITLLQSDYVRNELSKNNKARVTINVDLTFQPLTTEASFQF